MAQRVEVVLIDDIDGGNAAETVTFSLDGVTYEIDLSDKNARKLRDDFATWTGHARRAGTAKAALASPRGRRFGAAKRTDLGAVREWARANGHDGLGPRPHLGRRPGGLRQGALTEPVSSTHERARHITCRALSRLRAERRVSAVRGAVTAQPVISAARSPSAATRSRTSSDVSCASSPPSAPASISSHERGAATVGRSRPRSE